MSENLVIIPTYNEKENIENIIRAIFSQPHDFHILIVDDGSPDGTAQIVKNLQPDEIYNLAAMSHVKVSFDTPEYTANADGIGTLRILEAVRLLNFTKKTRIYQASTSKLS